MLRLGVKHYKMVFNYMEKYYSHLNWGVCPARRPPRLGQPGRGNRTATRCTSLFSQLFGTMKHRMRTGVLNALQLTFLKWKLDIFILQNFHQNLANGKKKQKNIEQVLKLNLPAPLKGSKVLLGWIGHSILPHLRNSHCLFQWTWSGAQTISPSHIQELWSYSVFPEGRHFQHLAFSVGTTSSFCTAMTRLHHNHRPCDGLLRWVGFN